MPWGAFKLSELNLDLQNVRTGNQPDQRAAIRALIDDQQQKLVNLAIDLLDVGPSPGEPIWVTADPEEPGRQLVLEGNRRVCALKLLDNPRLAEGSDVANAFAKLGPEFKSKPIRTLDAALFESRQAAQPFIYRRHMRANTGVGLEHWRSLAKERAQPGWSGKVRRSLLVLDYLDDDTDVFGEVGDVIEAKSTTVDRVLNNPAMRDVLGVHIDPKTKSITFENGDEIAGRRVLKDLITEMASPDFTFSKIRDEASRRAFITGFADRSVRMAGGAVASPERGEATSPDPASKGKGGRLTEPARAYLAPHSGSRTIANVRGKRLNKIYRECRYIKLASNENAAALLLRVFIELSSEVFLIEKDVPLPAKLSGKKKDWSEVGVTLEDKINAVMQVIDVSPRTKQQLKPARTALADPHRSGSIDTLHAYFHNPEIIPGVASLRDAWDTWEDYLRLLHAARI